MFQPSDRLKGASMQDIPTENQGQPSDAAPGQGPAAGKGFSVTAIVLGCISFLILPPYFGIPAVILAAVALKKRQRMARAAMIVAVLGLVVGTALNVLLFNAFHG
jgi:hypothetical protein